MKSDCTIFGTVDVNDHHACFIVGDVFVEMNFCAAQLAVPSVAILFVELRHIGGDSGHNLFLRGVISPFPYTDTIHRHNTLRKPLKYRKVDNFFWYVNTGIKPVLYLRNF